MINFFLKTYGCQANVADSAALASFLQELGCQEVDAENKADLIIINTCAVREKAEKKFFSYLGCLAEFKNKKKYLKTFVIGCVASYRKEEIYKRFDHVNFVFGAKEDLNFLKDSLADCIVKLESLKQMYGETEKSETKPSLASKLKNKLFMSRSLPPSPRLRRTSGEGLLNLGGIKSSAKELKRSLINIMIGCNNYCSYCIVPFTKGREKSYPASVILERVRNDVKNGAKEITLLGQNVNSYKDPETGMNFSQLLEKVAQIEGEFWVRFLSPHPKDMTVDVFQVIAANKGKLCAYIHHPLQSGSNKILKAMNRTYTVEQYLEQIEWVKEILPHATISTDIIVGFPGETEDDYEQTRQLMEKVKFDNIYPFVYSARKYTKAALLKDDCSKEEKTRRIEEIIKRQHEIVLERNSLNIGKNLRVLVEKRMANGKLLARTEGNMSVSFDGDDKLIGSFVDVKIEKAGRASLIAVLN